MNFFVLFCVFISTEAILTQDNCKDIMVGKLCLKYHKKKYSMCKRSNTVVVSQNVACLMDTENCAKMIDLCINVFQSVPLLVEVDIVLTAATRTATTTVTQTTPTTTAATTTVTKTTPKTTATTTTVTKTTPKTTATTTVTKTTPKTTATTTTVTETTSTKRTNLVPSETVISGEVKIIIFYITKLKLN